MTKSKVLWAIAALQFVVAWNAMQLFMSPEYSHWSAALFAILAIVAGGSLAFEQRWARYLVHVVGTVIILSWGAIVWSQYGISWPAKEYGTAENVLMFVPGVLLLVAILGSLFATEWHYRRTGRS